MQNEEGQNMDLYIPRKCSATNRLITSKDHASVQINVGHLDELGRYTGTFSTFALCGFVRAQVCFFPTSLLIVFITVVRSMLVHVHYVLL
ncbi:40S ribosomal protein S21-2-like [Hibiscus syriacus]|uniref:40S ribosomal protein S21-2-like n=1 Tax=Hibiscus syriacus TaxID=106335 RepID=UPI001921489C|nr:40S ribosomal protein S21-2-like [Hibiscus syriacus]